ncbi:hypothetical protein SAMN06265379_10910 [Saccharicrinis carchari]|uniref:Outer membrane protein beta-barrel domain-containing protein n=1 Tax=Saccharicrinis carchari TaxID=1168039 RepID=A0A521EFZ8_SACCC|nr:hypothetical protein [Saccharicrinis carchari]SMO82866.1 hypothetical protein SAMN06265379_10910 [Saccharicrinis carchari]
MNLYKLRLLLAGMLISLTMYAQEANVESIKKTLEPKQNDFETYEMTMPDIRWGLNIQGLMGEMSNDKNFTLGAYVKYKPFYRFDIDAGFKYYLASLDNDDFNFEMNDISYKYSRFSGAQVFLAINSSLALNKVNSHTAMYTSFEAGYARNTSDLNQYSNANERITSQTLSDGKMYVEWKLGFNFYGDFLGDNTGARVFVGANTVPYFLSAHTHQRLSKVRNNNYTSGTLLLGVALEFGLKHTPEQKANKMRKKENQTILEKYQGKSDKLF